MIQVEKGELKLDHYSLVIHPELSLATFRSGDIPIVERWDEREHSAVYKFTGSIDQMAAVFWITFASEKLCRLRFWDVNLGYDQKSIDERLFAATKQGHDVYLAELEKCREITRLGRLKQEERHNLWLEQVTGVRPPYEYSWGEIISGINPREGDAEILVRYKPDFGENVSLPAYFISRREQEHQLAMQPQKVITPGRLPPGFYRKKSE